MYTFSLLSIIAITLLWPLNFFGFFEGIIVADLVALIVLALVIGVRRKKKSWKRDLCLPLVAFTYGIIVFGTYLWSEYIFMERAISLASEIEQGCHENGECVQNLPGWEAHDSESGSRGLSTKWRFLFHKTSVHYRIQPDKRNFYLQEIYNHGRVTTIVVEDGHYKIAHEGSLFERVAQEGVGRIDYELPKVL